MLVHLSKVAEVAILILSIAVVLGAIYLSSMAYAMPRQVTALEHATFCANRTSGERTAESVLAN